MREYEYWQKPHHLNSESRWNDFGYKVKFQAPVKGLLLDPYSYKAFHLYDYTDCEPIKGKKA